MHQDNAPAHQARATQDVITEMGIEIMPHPPYSPDHTPCDFHLFPKVKQELRGRHFQSDKELNVVMRILNRLSKYGLILYFEKLVIR